MHTTQPATTQEHTKKGHGVFLKTLHPYLINYLLTYLLHGAESFFKS